MALRTFSFIAGLLEHQLPGHDKGLMTQTGPRSLEIG